MRNLHKLLIVLISVVFIASGVFAQGVADKPKENNQAEKKVNPEKPAINYQVMGITDAPQSQGGTILEKDSEGNVLQKQKSKESFKSSGVDMTKIVSPYGPNFNVKGTALDCPAGSLFDQSVVGYTTGVTSEADPGYTVYQYYSGVSGTISTITFWGINAFFDGGWVACSENPMEFNIGFYGDTGGAPDPGNQLETYTSTIDGVGTGEIFGGLYEIMSYTFTIPGGVSYADAWIGIQGAGSPDCWFLWVDSGTPGTLSYQDDGTGPAVTTYVQSLCLGGAASDNDVGVTSIISPVTGPDLGMEDVTIDIFNFGTVAQSNFDVFYTIDGGAPVTETVSATINGGDSYEYTFTQQADLSGYGTYVIEACTDLSGDETPANDCQDVSVQNYDPSSQCTFSVVLWDDYGDGWNGGTLTISVGGTVVLENITIETGAGPETFYFDVINGADVTTVFTAGGWPYECSYYIYDNDDNEVFSDGVGGVEPTGGTFTAVCIQFIYGDLAGTVTELSTGNPIEGAEIMVNSMTTYSASNGTYLIEGVMIGTWDVDCTMDGYNPAMASVEILEGQVTTQDFAMTAPTMDIDPLAVSIVIDPETQATEYIDIANNGDGALAWTADLEFLTEGKVFGYTGLSKDVIASEEAANADVIAVGTPMAMEKIKNLNIPMQMTKSGAKDVIDIIGSDANAFSAGPRSRGNLFTCTEERVLVEFMGWHNVTTDPTQMWMCVYEGDAQVGIYDLVVASDITPAPLGLGWVSSGVVDYLLVPGKYYLIHASFEQVCGYYNENPVTPFPYPVAFGLATGGAGWSYAPTSVFPPDATQDVPAAAFVDPVLYYQQLVTADLETWLTIDPTSGDVDPGNSEQMTLSFDATGIVPGTVRTAEITFYSDPNVGTVTVPVSMTVGSSPFGYIEGNVTLDGSMPYNIGDVTEVLVEAGPYSTYPDASGNYQIEVYPGTYDVTATLYGYETQTVPGIVVAAGATVTNVDFVMPTTYGRIMGTVTDIDTGDPIENATITVIDTEFEATTAADGTYEIFIEAGTYDVMANHPTYMAEVAEDVDVLAEADTQLDFELLFQIQCQFSVVLWDDFGDGWNGGALTISVDGAVVLENITIASGAGPETFYFDLGSGAEITCVFTAGGWPYECSYYVYDNDDNEVFSDGVGGVEPTGGTFIGTCIVFIYGDLEGTVTEAGTGNPIEGAEIMIDDMTDLTEADGTYLIEDVMIGTWDVYCNAVGYNPEVATGVVILEEQTTIQDFELTAPEFTVDPLFVEVTLEPNAQTQEVVTLTNPGNGTIDWEAGVVFLTDGAGNKIGYSGLTKDVIGSEEAANADVIAVGTQVPVDQMKNTNIPMTQTLGNNNNYPYPVNYPGSTDGIDIIGSDANAFSAGPRSRGNLFTCTTEKLLVEFMGWHNVTSDPTQMWMCVYEGDAQVGIYNLVVSVDVSPAPLGLGWVSSGPISYVLQEGKYYLIHASFEQVCGYYNDQAVTPFPYPVAFGLATGGAGWSYAPTSVFPPDATQDVPAAAFVDPVLYYQTLVTADGGAWLSIDPDEGTLEAGATEDMDLFFDATELLPGDYFAEIPFITDPNVGEPLVEVTMHVEGLVPAINLTAGFDCTDVELAWEMPAGGDPESWNVYRDEVLIGDATVMSYTDAMVDPEVEYSYTVKAVYAGVESQPTPPTLITVPTPADLEAYDVEAMINGTEVTLIWEAPDACLAPDSYSIYRDNDMIAEGVTGLEYVDAGLAPGFYEYYVIAVYYFGDSEASEPAYALITGIEDYDASMLQIFPNPANELVNVKSPVEITRIHVLNNSGQLVLDEEVNNMEYQIDVSQYEAGIYFIELETGEGITLRKVVVK